MTTYVITPHNVQAFHDTLDHLITHERSITSSQRPTVIDWPPHDPQHRLVVHTPESVAKAKQALAASLLAYHNL